MKYVFFIIFFGLITACGQNRSGLSFNDQTSIFTNLDEEISINEFKGRILAPHCLNCHKRMTTEEALLEKWIIPGKPEESRLFLVVENGKMPKNASPLSTADLEFIRNYINGLASKTVVTFEQIQKEVLEPSCIACHKRVTSEEALMRWINTEDPLNSKFIQVVRNGKMPKDAPQLDIDKQKLILQYLKSFIK